ncbi:MAG: FUSC family protein [Clostridiaceae bacterium]|nr:FUSC family protein [Clostridiaceae bacterium]
MKIGLRTIKTGIAVTLSMIVAQFMGIESPFFAVVAAIIVMQPTVSDSWIKGVERTLGTLVGAVVGTIFAVLAPSNPLLAGIGIIILIIIMNKLKWGESITIAGVVFIGIFLNDEGGHITYAIHRMFDTAIGIIVAVIVNYTIYPPTYDVKVVDEINIITKNTLKYNIEILDSLLQYKKANIETLDMQIQKIETELAQSEKFLEMQKKEEAVNVYGGVRHKEMFITLSLAKEVLQHMQNMQYILEQGIGSEVIKLIEEDISKVKDNLNTLKKKENQICEVYRNNSINLNYIIQDIKIAKKNLKNNENINKFQTDEVVKMLVFLYNLEETLLKFNMIISS